jgi:hypothetical protein
MSETKHTPGPWEWDEDETCMRLMGALEPNCHGLQILNTSKKGYYPLAADARLIAAAPDLYAACEAVLDYLENGESNVNNRRLIPNLDRLRAALAKASPPQ